MKIPAWVFGNNPNATLQRMLASIIIILATFWFGSIAMVGLRQHDMVYFPDKVLTGTPSDYGMSYEEVWLHSEDRTALHGWFMPSDEPSDVAVLFFHGNAGNVSEFIPFYKVFHQMGFPVFTIDYRGYGMSKGEPSEGSIYADAIAAWDYLTEKLWYEPDKIIIVGYSLGGTVATSMLDHIDRPLTVAVLSSFTSVYDMARERFPWLPISWIQHIYFPTETFLANYDGPLLVMHGTDDEVVPFAIGKKLFDQAPSTQKEFIQLPHGHNVYLDEPELFQRHLRTYLQRFSAIESAPEESPSP